MIARTSTIPRKKLLFDDIEYYQLLMVLGPFFLIMLGLTFHPDLGHTMYVLLLCCAISIFFMVFASFYEKRVDENEKVKLEPNYLKNEIKVCKYKNIVSCIICAFIAKRRRFCGCLNW